MPKWKDEVSIYTRINSSSLTSSRIILFCSRSICTLQRLKRNHFFMWTPSTILRTFNSHFHLPPFSQYNWLMCTTTRKRPKKSNDFKILQIYYVHCDGSWYNHHALTSTLDVDKLPPTAGRIYILKSLFKGLLGVNSITRAGKWIYAWWVCCVKVYMYACLFALQMLSRGSCFRRHAYRPMPGLPG